MHLFLSYLMQRSGIGEIKLRISHQYAVSYVIVGVHLFFLSVRALIPSYSILEVWAIASHGKCESGSNCNASHY